jgi:phosphosulfolactate synthase
VNLGNIATHDVIALETLRRGLRGDTLLALTTGADRAATRLPSAA